MSQLLEICVPDIGDFEDVEVVELLVAKGDVVEFDDPLVSVESDKATMEIPSTSAGSVVELRVAEGDRVSEGSVLVVLEVEAEAAAGADQVQDTGGASESVSPPAAPVESASVESDLEVSASSSPPTDAPSQPQPQVEAPPPPPPPPQAEAEPRAAASQRPSREMSPAAANPVPDRAGLPHASPLVRRYARELGVPIAQAEGTGPQGRVLVDDLTREVRSRFAQDAAGEGTPQAGAGIPKIPSFDPSEFGPVTEQPLTRIQKVSGPALHRSWLNVPHVTQHDEADLTELERFRRDRREAAAEEGVKLSPLLFVMKAVVIALRSHPTLRSSLALEGDRLLIKDYFHFGIAVDTDQGLVVPVIRDVDRKGIFELAAELDETAERARNRKLSPDDLKGACFTISSLGGIGGTAFSPIVNAPEVAILGLSKMRVQPVWSGPLPTAFQAPSAGEGEDGEVIEGRFEPRWVLPFSLSYDHRVIDGAEAVRFTSQLSRILSDPMRLLL